MYYIKMNIYLLVYENVKLGWMFVLCYHSHDCLDVPISLQVNYKFDFFKLTLSTLVKHLVSVALNYSIYNINIQATVNIGDTNKT